MLISVTLSNIGLFFIIFAVLIVVGLPIGVGIAMTGVVPSLLDSSFAANPELIIRSMLSGIDSFPLLAVPMFIISGIIMARGKISEKLFNMFAYFVGNRTAGMPIAAIVTCLFYGAISGSGPATTAAVGSMTIPILVSLNYDKTFVTAMVAVAGGLGKKTKSRTFNRATQSTRQTGSSSKPITLLVPGIQKRKFTASTIYDDTEKDFKNG